MAQNLWLISTQQLRPIWGLSQIFSLEKRPAEVNGILQDNEKFLQNQYTCFF